MVSTSGSRLLAEDAVETLKTQLLPVADLITPNIPEAEVLTGIEITGREDMQLAAEILRKSYGCAVLCKGGHSVSDADDLLYVEGRACWLPQERINNPNTHGTGCTLSSAIASNLAKGMDLESAVAEAKAYLTGALMVMMDLGKGSGPVDHAFDLSSRFKKKIRYTELLGICTSQYTFYYAKDIVSGISDVHGRCRRKEWIILNE